MARQANEKRELLKGSTPSLILAVLADAPRHGYAIAREIERRTDNALSLGEGSLYPALLALEQSGLVSGAWETRAPSGPARKVYTITKAGTAELARRTRDWRAFAQSIERVLGTLGVPESSKGAEPDVQPA
jgi:PadR family transcriptional regulator PadR